MKEDDYIWGFPKKWWVKPQIIHFNRVFHYFHHPFWGIPIFGNIHMGVSEKMVGFPNNHLFSY